MSKIKERQLLIVLLALSIATSKADMKYGILSGVSETEKRDFCIVYFDEFLALPSEKSESEPRLLNDTTYIDWCKNGTQVNVTDEILVITKSNCSVTSEASNVEDSGGKGILFLTSGSEIPDYKVNSSIAQNISIPVGLIFERPFKRLQEMGPVRVQLYAPVSYQLDFSLLIIWIIAMFTVGVGSHWSGHIRFTIYSKEISRIPGTSGGDSTNVSQNKSTSSEESSMNVSVRYVAVLVVCMGAMLVLLYFFFRYLVYIIIALFGIASILSVYSCLEPLVMKIPVNWCLVSDFHCGSASCNLDFRKIMLIAFAFAVSVFWVIIRNQEYAWILQDILGVMFCINMLKSIRLPSLKICFYLLFLLFFYDIFFVFVTPLMTGGGESVMEEVATGGNSNESLPMVLKVSHVGYDELSICRQSFSILGFGDILVPGLLISYCKGFDLISKKSNLYFPLTLVAYGIGLLITFGGVFAMNTAQPALLYLVPCTLIPPIILGWCKGDLPLLWSGFKGIKQEIPTVVESHISPEIIEETSNPVNVSTENPQNKRNDEKKQLLQ